MTILAARRGLPPLLIVRAGAAGLAPALDRAGRRVGPAHEAHRTTGGAAALEVLLRRADVGEVDARARSTLEDRALLAVPVEDPVHRVFDCEDETRAGLPGHALHADVEPHRRVEGGALGDEDRLELVAEGGALLLVDEVAVLHAPRRDRVGDAVDHLAQ